MWRKIVLSVACVVLWTSPVWAQTPVVPGIYTAGVVNGWAAISATNPLPISGSFSASLSGFTALTTGTPIAVTTGGVTGTLPAGTVVVATNAGTTNTAYCALGASATTASQPIPPGGWFAFTVGASTQLTCITSASTTTVNTTGGSGLPTGTGGGSGGSSSNASVSATGSAVPASATYIGIISGGNLTGWNGSIANITGTVSLPTGAATAALQNPVNVTPTDCSGSITAGGTAQNAIAATSTLHGFFLANIDSTSGSGEPIWISFTTTAAASTAASYALAAPAATTFSGMSSFTTPVGFATNHAVSVVGATTGHKFSCTQW